MSFLTIEKFTPRRSFFRQFIVALILLVVPIIIVMAWALSVDFRPAHAADGITLQFNAGCTDVGDLNYNIDATRQICKRNKTSI